jgi:hypothetical protein
MTNGVAALGKVVFELVDLTNYLGQSRVISRLIRPS